MKAFKIEAFIKIRIKKSVIATLFYEKQTVNAVKYS